MLSVQTKETSPALAALLKAKGQRAASFTAVVEQPNVIVEKSITEVPATLNTAPESTVEPVVPATPIETPAPNPRYSEENYLNLKAHHDKSLFERDQKISKLEDALSQATAPKIEFPKNIEELEAFKKTNPDEFAMIRAIALSAADELDGEVNKRLEVVNKAQLEIREKEAFNELLTVHPDAKTIRESVEFAKWFNEQPTAIRDTLANSTDVKAVIKLLTLYKIEALGYNPKETKKAAQQERIDASLGVNIHGATEIQPAKKIWALSEISAISSNFRLWEKHREEIDLARREGRVDNTK